LSGGDDAAQRQALEILDRFGAVPAAARLRRQMRDGVLPCHPEKYIFKHIVGAREAKTRAMTRGWGLDVSSIARSNY
jgi:hypothetical protein